MVNAWLQEGKATIEQARKLRQFSNLFKGLVFFLNREVPRDVFEFIICAFRGRVGWDGPGSPYDATDSRITHHIVDRPVKPEDMRPGREYVQPQWVADSINTRMLLPIAKYVPGATLPVRLLPRTLSVVALWLPDLDAHASAVSFCSRTCPRSRMM